MKRKLCIIVALSMIMATLYIPNFARAEIVDFNDYTTVEKPENMMTEPTSGNVFGNINSNVTKIYNDNSGWNSTYGTYNGYVFTAVDAVESQGASYANVGGFTTTNNAGGLIGKTLVKDKAYVVSFLARNIGTTDSFKVNMGLTSSSTWGPTYTIEAGETGYTVSDNTEWTKIAGTIIAPHTIPFLSVGFMNGEASGSKMEINLAYQPEEAIYFAEEVAYELNVTCEDTELNNADTVSVSAKLLNQVGTTGSLSQNFDWYVVNEDRTEQVPGFSINATADTAEITVENDVVSGNYVIVAVSGENDMAKGVEISVENLSDSEDDNIDDGNVDFTDYTPVEKPENMMTEPTSGVVFGNINSNVTKIYNENSGWNSTYGTYNGYVFTAVDAVESQGASYANVGGFTTTNNAGGLIGKTLVKDKAYVVSFLARNIGTTDSFKVNMGLTSSSTWGPTYTIEAGETGYTVSDDTEWTKIAGTIIAPHTIPFLSVGFMNGEASGSKMEINLAYQPEEAIYFAEEVAYELDVSCEDTELNNGDTVSVSAKLLNQVGTTGSLSQNFDWYVVNEDRTEQVPGFSINATADTAEITVEDDVVSGSYVIVAVSDENDMAKGIEISVGDDSDDGDGDDPGDDDGSDDDGDGTGETGDYSDSTLDKPENMMTEPTSGVVFGNINSNVTKIYNENSGWNVSYETYNGYIFNAEETVVSQGTSYANVGGFTITNSAGGLIGKTLVKNKAYVVSFLVRNIGTTDSFKVNMGLSNTDGNWMPSYTLENGEEGYTVSDRTNFTKIEGTIVAPCANPFFSAGFMEGEAAGSIMEINLAYQPEEAIYFAEEIPYVMEVMYDGAELVDANSTMLFKTKVTNQIGKVGNLTQDANYYVVNEERNQKVDGFTFINENDQKRMIISETVEPGIYYVIAENIDNPAVRKGVKLQVQRPYQADFIPDDTASAGEAHDIEVAVQQAKPKYTFLDNLTVSAVVLDIDDNEVPQAQSFSWKAYKENRRDEEENIVITQSPDTKTAEISFKSSIENGTYYIFAKKVSPMIFDSSNSSDDMQRAVKIVVDNSGAYSDIAAEINGATKESIKTKIDTYAQYANIPDDIYALVDKDVLSKVFEKTEFSADNIKETMLAACIVSLYVSNPQNVELNGSVDLSFVYAEELGISASGQSDVTLMELYRDSLSQAQRSNVMSVVNSIGVVSPEVFVEKLYETIILEGVKHSHQSLGTGYVLDYIKEANLTAANINKGKLTSSNANSYASLIAGKTLTKSGLETILANRISSSEDRGSGSSGGSKGSGGSGMQMPGIVPGVTVSPTVFSDVDESHWAFKQIDFLKRQNIISGKDGNNFCPNDYLKREEFTKIIVEAFELTGTDNAKSFKDIKEGAWYKNYINVASSNGIINGISEDSFGVGENITRQDLCVMIVRALGKESISGAEMTFTDKDEISPYAVSAVSYLNMLCVVNGYEDNTFRPRNLCTRAEAAKIIGDILNYEVKEIE